MWPPLHTTKMYNLHKNRTYAYYKILIEPKKKTAIKSKQHAYIWVCKTCLDLKKHWKKWMCKGSPTFSDILFTTTSKSVLNCMAYSLYRHRSVFDHALNYWPAVYTHFEKLVYCVFISLLFFNFFSIRSHVKIK